MSFRDQIDMNRIPQHLAIIMDGNGRWAKQKLSKTRIHGHRQGAKVVRQVAEASRDLGISFLTLYAFSTENWKRPLTEISALMELLVNTIRKELDHLHDIGIRFNTIGDIETLPKSCQKHLKIAMDKTAHNDQMVLTLALSYSGRWDITEACRKIAQEVKSGQLDPSEINEKLLSQRLSTAGIPDPELMIRTSGEYRISNYLMWQLAYSELYFTETFWPDFNREELFQAVYEYQNRERRFGKISEQISLND